MSIRNDKELEFAIFCIENVAIELNVSGNKIYDDFTIKSNILNDYIVASYDVLHTQGKEYIVRDIIETMEIQGVTV